jgi:hypothetical protein
LKGTVFRRRVEALLVEELKRAKLESEAEHDAEPEPQARELRESGADRRYPTHSSRT